MGHSKPVTGLLTFMKSGNLNFLEPSGPLQACNRTALPFYTQTMITDGIKTAVFWVATPGSQKIYCNDWKEHAAFIFRVGVTA